MSATRRATAKTEPGKPVRPVRRSVVAPSKLERAAQLIRELRSNAETLSANADRLLNRLS